MRPKKATQLPPRKRATRHEYSTEPTPRQKAVWEWIIAYQRSHCMPPSIREVSERFSFGSTNAAMSHYRALVKKGLMMRKGGLGDARSYLAVFKDDRCPCCGRKPMGQSEFSRKINEPDPGEHPPSDAPLASIPSAAWRSKILDGLAESEA